MVAFLITTLLLPYCHCCLGRTVSGWKESKNWTLCPVERPGLLGHHGDVCDGHNNSLALVSEHNTQRFIPVFIFNHITEYCVQSAFRLDLITDISFCDQF